MNHTSRSPLTAPRAGDPVAQGWKHVVRAVNDARERSDRNASQDQRIRRRERLIRNIASNLYPFRIYHLPFQFRQTDDQSAPTFSDATDWRKIRVRTGGITVLALPNPTNPVQVHDIILPTGNGLDGCVNPDIETFMDNPLAADILVPENDSKFYIWITLTVANGEASAQLFAGDNQAAAGDNSSWPTFPQMDQYHQLVGWVDSATYANLPYLDIRQLARTDMLFAIC